MNRPLAQRTLPAQPFSRPLVYALTNQGNRLLVREESSPTRIDNHDLKHLYLEHTLLVADFMVSLETACAAEPHIELRTEEELAQASRFRDPFRWTVRVDGRRLGLRPDKVFSLRDTSTNREVLFFLEADRGTMPVKRRGLQRSSFHRKLLAYVATWQQGVHQSRFGISRFRVLTVTSSAKRLEHLRAATSELDQGRGLFLFGEEDGLVESNPLSMKWQTAVSDKPEALLPL